MDLLEPDDVPLAVHEDILKYLKEQDLLGAEDEILHQITNFSEQNVKQIVEELLQRFERDQKLKEDYEERRRAHNQFCLFKLADILPDFKIDDEMYEALTFREILLVQRQSSDDEFVTESVGGLCLDIQQAVGKPPKERKCDDICERLARVMNCDATNDVVQIDRLKDKNIAADDKLCTEDPDLEDSLEVQGDRCIGKFLVHLSSQFDFDGDNAGSSITTWVDRNMHTIEEKRREFYTRKVVKHIENVEKVIKKTSYETEDKEDDIQIHSDLSSDLAQRIPDKATSTEKAQIRSDHCKTIGSECSKMSAKISAKPSDPKEGINSKSAANTPNVSQKSSRAADPVQEKSSGKNSKRVSTSEKMSSPKTSNQMKSPRNSKDSDQLKGEIVEELQLIQKSLYVGLFKKYYYIKYQTTEESPIDDRKFYSLQKAKDYISEGANFLLHRYLAITIYIGTFELSTMYINGDMCRNIYTCTGPESKLINEHKIDACTIYRTIIEECGIEHQCTTVLTLKGQIVSQSWEGVSYSLQINPLLDVDNYTTVGNEKILLKHAWENDMQLMSKYLDEKVANEIKIKSYMIDHPEFRSMITDYINTILLLKPEDIIEFTISHFLSFAPQFLPQNDYL